jgi:hypothetical protein
MAKRHRTAGDRATRTSKGKKSALDPRHAQADVFPPDETLDRRRRARAFVNAIAPARVPERPAPTEVRGRKREAQAPAAGTRDTASIRRSRDVVPDEIKRRFVAAGNVYYFPDGARAFVDRGDRLTTRSENSEVIAGLAAIAHAREWREITVSGTRRFKQEMWLAARLAGLEVRGYAPDPREEARLIREIARRTSGVPRAAAAGGQAKKVRSAEEPTQWRGRLIEHGAAPYQHKPTAETSYFVKIETPSGTKEIWGIDLGRAVHDSLSRPKPGDEVVLHRVGQEAVTVRAVERDENGRILKEAPLATHRNRWVVEKRDFFEDRAQAAQVVRDPAISAKTATGSRPELTGTYLQLRAAEMAARRLSNPTDRAQFIENVRKGLADAIARGDPMPTVDVLARERTQAATRRGSQKADRLDDPVRE